jgi:hypothetical protein
MEPSQNLEQGRLVTITSEHTLPIPVKLFWSGLDDFFAISSTSTGHSDSELITGAGKPSNGVGTEVSFTSGGKKTREVLLQKDDLNHVWVVGISEPNEDFLYYRATLSAWEGANGPVAKYTVEVILAGDHKHRAHTLESLKDVDIRVLDILVLVLKRDGTSSKFEWDIDCPMEKFWDVITNWNDPSWVIIQTGFEKLPDLFGRPNRRIISSNNGFTDELQRSVDPRTHFMTYFVHKSTMPLYMYMGQIHLSAVTDDSLKVNYCATYLAKEGTDVLQYKAVLEKTFATVNIPGLQKKFGKKSE